MPGNPAEQSKGEHQMKRPIQTFGAAAALGILLAGCDAGGASSAPAASNATQNDAGPGSTASVQETASPESSSNANLFYLTIGEEHFTASFAETSGARALKQWLAERPVTVEVSDYGGFEKVGGLGRSLPTEDVQTTTKAGDIVLYQGNQIVLFYGSNSWAYTRLGAVSDLDGWEDALGEGDLSVTLSLTEP